MLSPRTCLLFFLALVPLVPAAQTPGIQRLDIPGLTRPADPQPGEEQLAAQYFRNGEFDKAAILYGELYEKDPSPAIYSPYLESLLALEEYRQAERLVRNQLRQFPGQLRYEVDLGMVFGRAGNDRQARRQFDQLIQDLPARPQPVIDLAAAFEMRGMTDRALEALLQGRRLLGSAHPFNLRIAPLYEKKGNHRAMMEEYIGFLEENLSEMERVRGILQDAIANDPDFSRNEALRDVLLARTQRHPNATLYAEMLLWLSIQQKDFRLALMQARALDRRFRQEGELVLEVARLSTTNQQYGVAAQAYQYILEQGEEGSHYMDALVGHLDVRFLAITSAYEYRREELLQVEGDYLEALEQLGVHPGTVSLVRNLARLQAFYLGKVENATGLLQAIIDMPQVALRIKAECRIELADILLMTGDVWEATLLYAQVDKQYRDNPLGHEARFKNARLSYFIGEFDWARAQLDVLKAATSRLIANDAMELSLRIQDNIGFDGDTEPLIRFARAESLLFMNRLEEAILTLDSISERFPQHAIMDDLLVTQADIRIKQGRYADADSLLAIVVERYPDGLLAGDALFRRAGLHEQVFGDKERAMGLYQQLMLHHPGSLHTATARNRFRALRGDLVN